MKSKLALGRCIAILAIAGLALLAPTGGVDPAGAKNPRDARRDEAGQSHGPGVPMLAIVSLSDQRVTIYDAEGKMLQSPVSTGATGLETPAGIFSVVQKKEVHASNIYEDGNMPFMQRITWTGIAMHAGVLPGQPASHGCVRMPHAFAQRHSQNIQSLSSQSHANPYFMRPLAEGVGHHAVYSDGRKQQRHAQRSDGKKECANRRSVGFGPQLRDDGVDAGPPRRIVR